MYVISLPVLTGPTPLTVGNNFKILNEREARDNPTEVGNK